MFSKKTQALAKPCVKAIKVLTEKQGKRWEWEPEAGERVTHVVGTAGLRLDGQYLVVAGGIYEFYIWVPVSKGIICAKVEGSIPLLGWEKILRLLRDLGYGVFVETQSHNCRAIISRDGMEITRKIGEDSQFAVMQAVIEAAKED